MSSLNSSSSLPTLKTPVASVNPTVSANLDESVFNKSITTRPGDTIIIGVLGQEIELLNIMPMDAGPIPIFILTFQILGYDDTTLETTIVVPVSSPIFFQNYSRDHEPIGQLIPFKFDRPQDTIQEKSD